MKKVVIFDVDETLLRLRREESDAYVKSFEICYGITGINDDWQSYRQPTSDIGIAEEILMNHFGRRCREGEVATIEKTFIGLLREINSEPVSGIQAVLEALAEMDGVGFALSTGNWEKVAGQRLAKAGIGKYFRFGGFAEDGYGKTAILGAALEKCRQAWPDLTGNDGVIYIGDRLSDAEAACTHGTQFIGINPDKHIFEGYDVEHIFPYYRDLDRFMETVIRLWRGVN